MTQTDQIKNYLTKNGLSDCCNTALKKFEAETGLKVSYAAFRRVYIMFNEGKNVLQSGPQVDERFKTIEHRDRHDIKYLTWENIPKEEIPTIEHIGKPVLIADPFLQKSNYTLLAVHMVGTKGWPNGGYSVKEEATGYTRCFETDSVRLING